MTTAATAATATAFVAPHVADRTELSCDVLVIGGGTAGTMAAISAAENGADVLLLEKAHVRHSGALAMGMDGVNNAVIPGKATPEAYIADITKANDGVVNQRTVAQTAYRGFDMVKRLESYGVKFDKDDHGEYHVRQVHRSGSYVLPMPEGKDVKKVLYRVLRRREMRERIQIENRVMPVRVLTSGGRAVGAVGFNTRTGEFVTVAAGAVILATGPCGRLGLPASGYLYGTYENPTNAGDGYAMAYHAGAELSGIECFQVNPLIKDYNGPACAYVANPFGGYQTNAEGTRFVDCDYWSGQMMAEVKRELDSARGPIYLKVSHLPHQTLTELEGILHTTERPTRGTFHANRGHDYRTHDVEMHISEIGLCSGHSASGVWVDENARTTVPGLYAAGDLACVPHNYMIGAFVYGDLAGTDAAAHVDRLDRLDRPKTLPEDQIRDAHGLIYRPLSNPDGPPQTQVEYKLRRFVNDYVAPPKTQHKLALAVETFERMTDEISGMGGRTPHELMRCAEVTFIRDCAEMAARSSLVRTESRWGHYHDRADLPERDDEEWLCHLNLRKTSSGAMEFVKRPVNEYVVPVDGFVPRPDAGAVYLGEMASPRRATGPAGVPQVAAHGPQASARVLEVVALAEGTPVLEQLRPYLSDADAEVRKAAITTLTETAPEGVGLALADALDDGAADVRRNAAAGLVELVEVLTPDDALRARLTAASAGHDVQVRVVALEVLRVLRLADETVFAAVRTDAEPRVRIQAVRGLVSLRAVDPLTRFAEDEETEVRAAVAHGLATLADGTTEPLITRLAADPEPAVRAAALTAAAAIESPGDLTAIALASVRETDPELRQAAARALGAATSEEARTALLGLAADEDADVRKAAVRALTPSAENPEIAEALRGVLADPDADVRGFARQALERHDPPGLPDFSEAGVSGR